MDYRRPKNTNATRRAGGGFADARAPGYIRGGEENRAKLTFVDSVKDEFFQTRVSVFVSHQWLGRDHPDPENIQYNVICASLRDISERCGRPLGLVVVEREYARDEVLIQELAARV